MNIIKVLCLGLGVSLALAALNGCAAFRVDPAVSRPDLQLRAVTHIDRALTAPVPDLYAAAEGGNAYASLDLGLALLAGRHREPTAQDLADMEVLAVVEARLQASAKEWQAKNPGKIPVYSKWAKTAPVSEAERAIALRLMKSWSADYWLSRALNATTNQTIYIYQPPVKAGAVGTTMPINISTPVIDSGLVMTAAHCVNSVRQGLGLPGGEPDLLTFRLLYPLQTDMNATLAHQLATPDPQRAWYTGPEACGGDATFLNYLKLRNSSVFTPSPLGMRFGIGG